MWRTISVCAIAAIAVSACGVGGGPGKREVQKGLEELAKETPLFWGNEKPLVKDAKCKKAAEGIYDCTAVLAVSSRPDETMTQSIKLTKLKGKWHAQMNNLGALGG